MKKYLSIFIFSGLLFFGFGIGEVNAQCSTITNSSTCSNSCSPVKTTNGMSYKCQWLSATSKCSETSQTCGVATPVPAPACNDYQLTSLNLSHLIAFRCNNLGATSCQKDSAGNNTGYQCSCINMSPGVCTVYANNCSTLNLQACPITSTAAITSPDFVSDKQILCGSSKTLCREDDCHCLNAESCSDQVCDPTTHTFCTQKSGRSWCRQGLYGATCCVAGYKCGPNSSGCVLVNPPTATPPISTWKPVPTPTPTPTPPPGAPLPLYPNMQLSCPTTSTLNVGFGWTSAISYPSYYLRIDDLSNGWVTCPEPGVKPVATPNPGDSCNIVTPSIGKDGYYTYFPLPINKSYRWWISGVTATNTQSALSSTVDFSIGNTCPTPTPILEARCVMTSMYSPNWTPMTSTDFFNLLPNSQVYFCTQGSTNQGAFSKARFTINGVLRPEVTLLRPGSSEFCDLYTIPSGVYNFGVQGEVYHSTLGWL